MIDMKANELMIGDWVNFLIDITGGETEYDSQTIEYQPMQIVSISAWINNDGDVESREGVICDIEQLTPIPLTSEILERNEFKFCCTDVFEEWRSEDKRITIHDEEYPNSFNKWSIHVDTEDMRTMGYFEITYVHELQHALRLCGINKEIKI